MHEMSLIRPVVDAVLDTCNGRDIAAVTKVYLTIGESYDVLEDYIPGLFRFLARDTIAKYAEVAITRIPIRVRCNDCGEIWQIKIRDESTWTCPRCGSHQNYSLFSGREFRIDSIEVEPLTRSDNQCKETSTAIGRRENLCQMAS
jgi:hydrogenase nickel incorporation protein HypA/HybF